MNYSPESGAEVKNEWSLSLTSLFAFVAWTDFAFYASTISYHIIHVQLLKNVEIFFLSALILRSENDNAGVS